MKVSKTLLEQWKKQVKLVNENSPKPQLLDDNKNERFSESLKDFQTFVTTYFPHLCRNEKGEIIKLAPFHLDAVNAILNLDQHTYAFTWF